MHLQDLLLQLPGFVSLLSPCVLLVLKLAEYLKQREKLKQRRWTARSLAVRLASAPYVVGLALAEYLRRRGWTARSLAVRAGLPEKTVNRILTGKVKTPHLATMEAITHELGASPEKIGLGAAYQYRLLNAEKRQR